MAINWRSTQILICGSTLGMQPNVPNDTPTARRIRREAQAAATRARALAMRDAGATCARIGRELGVCTSRAAQNLAKAERLRANPNWWDCLPARAQNLLHYLEPTINLLDLPEAEAAHAIARFTRRQLLDHPNFGKGGCAAIIEWLARHGLRLQPESAHASAVRLQHIRMKTSPAGATPLGSSIELDKWKMPESSPLSKP